MSPKRFYSRAANLLIGTSRATKRAIIVAGFLLLLSSVHAEILYVVNSQSRTLSRIDTTTDNVNNTFATLGTVPNKIIVDSDYLWAVNSGDNAIRKISRSSGATISNIFIGMGSNPWDAVLHQNYLYVSGLLTGKVYRVDTQSGLVTGNVNVGTAPEALQVINNKLYVCNAGNYAQNYAGSSVSVIDLDSFSVIATIPVSANPQYLASHNGMLHVSCTGNWTDIGGAICIIDPASDTVIHTIDMGGTPGRIWIANAEQAFVADNNGVYLYGYNPQTYQLIYGAGNPFANGGSEIDGNSNLVAVLSPNWGGNGIVKILHSDLSAWKQYSVAIMPTDLKLEPSGSDSYDPVFPIPKLYVYPNPVQQGSKLEFSSSANLKGELVIYNMKGQKLASHPLMGKSNLSLSLSFASGVYFYRVEGVKPGTEPASGKFVVLK